MLKEVKTFSKIQRCVKIFNHFLRSRPGNLVVLGDRYAADFMPHVTYFGGDLAVPVPALPGALSRLALLLGLLLTGGAVLMARRPG